MLKSQKIKAFVSTTQPDKASEFYSKRTRVVWFKDPSGNILSVSD